MSYAARVAVAAARDGVDWFLWRLVTSNRIHDGLAVIRSSWTIAEITHAHIALDAMEDMDADARRGAT